MPLIQSRLSHVSIDHSFLLINSTIPLHGCTRVYLNIYPLKGIWDYWQYFAIMKKVAMNIHIWVFIWTYTLSFLSEYLNWYIGALFKTFLEASKLLSKIIVQSVYENSSCPIYLKKWMWSVFFNLSLKVVLWYLLVLICIFRNG